MDYNIVSLDYPENKYRNNLSAYEVPLILEKITIVQSIYSALQGLYVRPTMINVDTITQHCKEIFFYQKIK